MTDHAWLEARFTAVRPKAIAALTRQLRDLDLAEEAFATSCLRAVKVWPEKGVPNDPLAWLLTVGRNAGLDIIRRKSRAAANPPEAETVEAPEDGYIDQIDNDGLRDDVLRLLFICCHPNLTPQDQLALALRIVTGMSVDEIASAFLVKPKTMEQRITRAKRAVARADVPFETPDLKERLNRFRTVSVMLYLLFNEGWSASSGDIQIRLPLCEEAIRLARLLLNLFPGMSEMMGLLALFLFQHSRRHARLDDQGHIVRLEEQDRSLWDLEMIAEADSLLEKAWRHGAPGPYQIQAAIAAVHARAQAPDEADWQELAQLYAALYVLEPTPVVKLNHAAAVANIEGPEAALAMLEPLAGDLENYRWFHAARAGFLHELKRYGDAKLAYEAALHLDPTDAERHFLQQKIDECDKSSEPVSGAAAAARP